MTKTFSPEDVNLFINGFEVTGFDSESFIDVIPNSDYFQHVPGIRGKHSRKRLRDRSGTVRVRLMQTHPDNEIFTRIVQTDDFNYTGLLNITIVDVGGQTYYQYGNCYITGIPSTTFNSSSLQAREWTINYEYVISDYLGGNNAPPIQLF